LTQFSISLAVCQGDGRIDNEADPLMGVRIVCVMHRSEQMRCQDKKRIISNNNFLLQPRLCMVLVTVTAVGHALR
jgi:hypothetical protein